MGIIILLVIVCIGVFLFVYKKDQQNRAEKERRKQEILREIQKNAENNNVQTKSTKTRDDYEDKYFYDNFVKPIEEAKKREEYVLKNCFNPLPFMLQQNRTKYRALYKEGIALQDDEKIAEALTNLYENAIRTVYCYGSLFSNTKGIIGAQYDAAIKAIYDNSPGLVNELKQFNYDKFGRISGCLCLSETDWKHFESFWGKKSTVLKLKDYIDCYPGLNME